MLLFNARLKESERGHGKSEEFLTEKGLQNCFLGLKKLKLYEQQHKVEKTFKMFAIPILLPLESYFMPLFVLLDNLNTNIIKIIKKLFDQWPEIF